MFKSLWRKIHMQISSTEIFVLKVFPVYDMQEKHISLSPLLSNLKPKSSEIVSLHMRNFSESFCSIPYIEMH